MSPRRQNTTQTSQNPITEPLQYRVPSTNDTRTRPTPLDNQSSFREVPPLNCATPPLPFAAVGTASPIRLPIDPVSARLPANVVEMSRDPIVKPVAVAPVVPRVVESNAPRSRGVWDQGPGPRGEAIERRLGQNLPQNYPTIDRFENGVATSIKSVDLAAPSYLHPAGITRTGQGYVDAVAGFRGRNWAGVNIRPGDIRGRGVDIAVPPGPRTPAQQQALDGVVGYGRQNGVTVRIVEIE
jgi:hypothetical protein